MPVTREQENEALPNIADAAVDCEERTQFPAAVSATQCILESDWLTKAPGNNCFGIKHDGRGTGQQFILTHEEENGESKLENLGFEKYATLADCFQDHAEIITRHDRYSSAWTAYQQTHDVDAFCHGIADAGYATGHGYAQQLIQIVHQQNVVDAIAAARTRAHPCPPAVTT